MKKKKKKKKKKKNKKKKKKKIQLCTSDSSTAHTAQLCERILQISLQKLTAKTSNPVSQTKYNLPSYVTRFVGRQQRYPAADTRWIESDIYLFNCTFAVCDLGF